MRAIGNFESADMYDALAREVSDSAFNGWIEQLGFGIKRINGVALLIDDCGNEREATLNERVLWDALISATSEFVQSE